MRVTRVAGRISSPVTVLRASIAQMSLSIWSIVCVTVFVPSKHC